MKTTLTRLAAALMVAIACATGPAPVLAADTPSTPLASLGQVVHLALNKSMVIDVPQDVKDVLISNPAIADAVIRTSRKIYLIGMAAGETNVFLFGAGGSQISQFELVVSRDVVGLEAIMAEVVPGARVRARTIGDTVVLSGTAPTPQAAGQLGDLAAKFAGDPTRVVNTVTVAGTDQVHLKVVVAEVQRDVVKNLGIDTQSLLQAVALTGSATSSLATGATELTTVTKGIAAAINLSSAIKLLGQQGLMRTLAEPTLTSTSGETANFLAGGEFPIPMTTDDGIEVQYRQFGVALAFTPVVLDEGRISLRIRTEVSELSTAGAVNIGGLTIPALTVRRAESTLELPSGGSLVMAGLIKDTTRQTVTGFPGLMDVPILGSLFKSREYQRNQTELAIFVSPYLVNSIAANEVTRPGQNLTLASDAQTMFLGQLNRVYRAQAAPVAAPYYGRYGFSFE